MLLSIRKPDMARLMWRRPFHFVEPPVLGFLQCICRTLAMRWQAIYFLPSKILADVHILVSTQKWRASLVYGLVRPSVSSSLYSRSSLYFSNLNLHACHHDAWQRSSPFPREIFRFPRFGFKETEPDIRTVARAEPKLL